MHGNMKKLIFTGWLALAIVTISARAQLITNTVPAIVPPSYGAQSVLLTPLGSYYCGLQMLHLTNDANTFILSTNAMLSGMTNAHCQVIFDFVNSNPGQVIVWTNNIYTTITIRPMP